MIQGFFEVGGGLGFVIGPTLGGVLYEVSYSACKSATVCHNNIANYLYQGVVSLLSTQYGGFKVPFIIVGTLSLVPIIPSFLLIKPSGSNTYTGASTSIIHNTSYK